MEKKTLPYQLVVHMDENGVRASCNYRTTVYDDDGSVIGQKLEDAVTLDKAGKDFQPFVDKFMKEIHAEALKQCDGMREVEANLVTANAQVEDAKKLIADREALISQTAQNIFAVANKVKEEIEARQPKASNDDAGK